MDRKIVALEGGNNPDKLAEHVRNLEKEIPHLIKHNELMAKLLWAKYSALLDQGFTKEQALELCKNGF